MKISAVISEFNPFHKGHKFIIDKMRENGATHIVAVVSGNFVQRGECAVFSKWDRAKQALENGVDLVVENPLVFATASAQRFAFGGVNVIKGLGCVDELSFGSESGKIDELTEVSDIIEKDDYFAVVQKFLNNGLSYPKAREMAIREQYGNNMGDILSSPNNILACEYISECKKAGLDIDFYTIRRESVDHDSAEENNGFYSASLLREMIKQNSISCDEVFEMYRNNCKVNDFAKLETAILVKLRSFTENDFLKIPDVSEGIENRLYSAAQKACSLSEFFELVKTKRYTLSRIRRICLCALLGINKEDVEREVPYVRVIGFNEKGREILKTARSTATLPIVMKYSDIKELDENAKRIFDIESFATDIFALTGEKNLPCGLEKTENIVIIK
ncbi:MAG: nucleotidyltransferase family protein [Clostridia bacterium]|nr:nucleotidyltransferase family protein [Clostridia bacterium]